MYVHDSRGKILVMIALKIKDIKKFMNLLFASENLDDCFLEEATIRTFADFSIDGHFNPSFFGDEADAVEKTELIRWKMVRPSCLSLIRGRNTPLYMKFVFHYDIDTLPELPDRDNVKALLFMVQFRAGELTVTTGSSQKTFSLDKDADHYWDDYLREKIISSEISFDE